MNILVPDSWLREHLKTKATTKQIANYLSLCSQSVERVIRKNNDWIYDIEITTNRPDCLSIYGIARELTAVLPRFGIKAQLKPLQEAENDIPSVKKSLPLEVDIKNKDLCPRFTALIFDQIKMGPSPKVVQERLKKADVRALDNVVDISNYLMLELGQPMHTFDYDKVLGAKMILRESAGGEKITTLDGQSRPLPDGTIIIEDGQGRIIDLCGIMGGANSEVDQKTKRVLLFVQTYSPIKIRQACQKLGFRTEAASRFEKGIEPEGVIPAMKKAIAMFKKNCGARVASNLIDIYPQPQEPLRVSLSQEKLNQVMGVEIGLVEAKKILDSLGFEAELEKNNSRLSALVPHWRHGDVAIPEDLVEEVARLYGYHRLPTVLPRGEIPQETKNSLFDWEERAKDALKGWGWTEVANYSVISREMLEAIGYQPRNYLKLANPLTQDWLYMRPSLIPSVLGVIAQNQALFEKIKIFEMANVYLPRGKEKLPEERMTLTAATSGFIFNQVKGVLEELLTELAVNKVEFEPCDSNSKIGLWHPHRSAMIKRQGRRLGTIGEIRPSVLKKFGIKGRIVVFDLDFEELAKLTRAVPKYAPIPKYPASTEDLTFVVPAKTLVGEMLKEIQKTSRLIVSADLLDTYKNARTFRITYQNPTKTLTDQEVTKLRKTIIQKIAKKFKAKLKT